MSAISGITSHSAATYVQEAKHEQINVRTESTEISNMKEEFKDRIQDRRDEYIRSDAPELTGIYKISKDENGNARIMYEAPNTDGDKKTAEPDDEAKPAEDSKYEKCTVNTDKVDAEIERLKEEIEKLEQRVSQAEEGSKEQEKLKGQLSQLELKLSQKDNDTYRRQHAQYTE